MAHGDRNGEFMEDWVNGAEWHVPDSSPNEEIDRWLES